MKTCLLHAKTFARISERLKGLEHKLDILVMDEDGLFYHAGNRVVVDAPRPDIVFGNTDVWFGPHARDFMTAVLKTGKIDWFQSSAAGLDNAALISVGRIARLYTTNHTQAEGMAEWALWQALDFLKLGPTYRTQQEDRVWKRHQKREIMGSDWLIIGFGSIGEAVGRRVRALGGKVIGVRRSPGPAEGADHIVPPALIHEELGKADIVLLSVPLTGATEGMADADFFAAMKEDALFMNLGRGGLVREDALIHALEQGRPARAALDVASEEPLPPENPLWHQPNLSLTPHDSPMTDGMNARADETFLDNLDRYLNGKPMRNLVAPETFSGDAAGT